MGAGLSQQFTVYRGGTTVRWMQAKKTPAEAGVVEAEEAYSSLTTWMSAAATFWPSPYSMRVLSA